jgi:photosystem II stability/assembly factor-like uncharacterized protein
MSTATRRKHSLWLPLICAIVLAQAPIALPQERATGQLPIKGLQWRSIGPHRGGRVTAVAGVATQPYVYYFGATGGGVWKTTDGGVNWVPVSDGQFGTGSVGGIGIAESDPNVIYVGMGEAPIRGNVSHGDGVYKSTDAGKTWKNVGLEDSRQIPRVRVHPRNPDLAYAAVLGHVWGSNEQRGIFRTRDGGKNWERVLFRSNKAGASDLVLDPTNPSTLYAGFWEVYRTPYSLESGGPGSGILKSTDGGDTWSDLTRNPGLPKGLVGKVGIAVSPLNPERVWALVEAEDGGVFRSENGGRSWTRVNEDRRLRQRAWYYTRIYADTGSADTVYVLNTGFYKSVDGGRSYTSIAVPHGDNHDLWIAPNDPNRMINSNDGGANVSVNGGKTWTEQDQATAQFYRVALDNDFPYHVYGAQQDNSTVRIASRTNEDSIGFSDWYDVGGGESGHIVPDPRNSEIVYAGSYGGLITRYNHRTRQQRNVNPWPDNPMGHPASDLKYRFQWNFPIAISLHDPTVIYSASNHLHRSTNEGSSWEVVSPDLTRNDRSRQGPSGGPITRDNTSVEYYATIFALSESPVQKGVIWVGSDDGLVHLSRDNAKSWNNVTPAGIPEWIQINSIDASSFDAGTAYVAGTMYKSDDNRPYLYKTSDYGKTWKKITRGIPESAFTRVVREDPNRRGLLYAGTETGIYVSFDDGENWQSLQLNLPVVPITDLAVHKREKELVVATQGRSFWILDDLTILHQLNEAAAGADVHLFKPDVAYRMAGSGGPLPPTASVGANPPAGAVIYYLLKAKAENEVAIEILDSAGKSIRKFSSKAAAGESPAPSDDGEGGGRFGGGAAPRVTTDAGLNRFIWDFRYPDASRFQGLILWSGETRGPRCPPGNYQVKLTAGGKTLTETFEVKKDPRVETTPEEFAKQFELSTRIRDKLTETHDAIVSIRDVRRQVDEFVKRVKDQPGAKPIEDAAKSLNGKLTAIEEELYQTKNRSNQDPLNYPIKLNNRLAALGGVVSSADAAPTAQSVAVYQEVAGQIDAQLAKLAQVMKTDLPAFNKLVRDQNLPAVFVKSKEPADR